MVRGWNSQFWRFSSKEDSLDFVHRIIRYGGVGFTSLYTMLLLIFLLTWCGPYRPYMGVGEVLLVLLGG
ncbi:MAG: hypothetical protein ACE5R6_17640 [Candidatus Heimdallarchaeota archaeon]